MNRSVIWVIEGQRRSLCYDGRGLRADYDTAIQLRSPSISVCPPGDLLSPQVTAAGWRKLGKGIIAPNQCTALQSDGYSTAAQLIASSTTMTIDPEVNKQDLVGTLRRLHSTDYLMDAGDQGSKLRLESTELRGRSEFTSNARQSGRAARS